MRAIDFNKQVKEKFNDLGHYDVYRVNDYFFDETIECYTTDNYPDFESIIYDLVLAKIVERNTK